MRRRIFLGAFMLLSAIGASAAEIAEDGWKLVPLTLKKSGNCSGTMTVTERDTHHTLASCRVGCDEITVQIPAGTWIRVSTQAAAQCGGGFIFVNGTMIGPRRATSGYLPAAGYVLVGDEGASITTSFSWMYGGWRAMPTAAHVK